MKTRAAVLRDVGKPFEIVELDLDEPKADEVLIRFVASGLCHSDDHLRTGDIPVRYPIVGGHEGAGIVEKVGPGVTRLAVGDHVVTSWLPGLRALPVLLPRPDQPVRPGPLPGGQLPAGRHLPLPRGHAPTSGRCACSARSRSTPWSPSTRR